MKKVLLLATLIAVLVVSFAGIASAAPSNPAQFCKDGGREVISNALENALFAAHSIRADINISQGACASTIATHMGADGKVNTQALATSFCKQVGVTGRGLSVCVNHVQPTLLGIFHGS
ncbi:MAG: hypothetical protein MUC51_09865 [Anaerolineae bacterium]|jgi:hypothetical protein|nr:hypothetical protein [Anaerolineae bacterium]